MNTRLLFAAVSLILSFTNSLAQAPRGDARRAGERRAPIISPEVSPERKITFRISAPKAESVKLNAGDIQGLPKDATTLTKDSNGIWQVTLGPVSPGAYRYTFNVDGVAVVDPHNPAVSESNDISWSLVYVPGAEFMDTRPVPHGAVAEVTYHSSALNRFRRMHIYTPPGYESGKGAYPVLYLLHGASDSDASWSTVGRANFILDNLIASKKAVPMIVVMPAGHTGPFSFGGRFRNDFEKDFVSDIMPYVEQHYRLDEGRNSRAIAGLSMGGAQTLNIGFENLDHFGYLGVFSSGIFGITGDRARPEGEPSWEEAHKATLDDPALKNGLKLIWFATGEKDFLLKTSEATVSMLKKHGFDVQFKQSPGAHTWLNWREYLEEFAPKLFR
jgi:enterochelin esterase family protein